MHFYPNCRSNNVNYVKKTPTLSRFFRLLMILFFLLPFQAHADITLTFYSHDFGTEFPHTFVSAEGVMDDGTAINENFGFTAKHISPRVLLGSVQGVIEPAPEKYLRTSDPQFRITVSDQVYREILQHKITWQSGYKRSYNLNKRNCVHYIGEVLKLSGLKINANSSNFKKPKSFLREVMSLNPALIPYNEDVAASQTSIIPAGAE